VLSIVVGLIVVTLIVHWMLGHNAPL